MKVKLTKDVNRSGYSFKKDQSVYVEFPYGDSKLVEVVDNGHFLGVYLYEDEFLIEGKSL